MISRLRFAALVLASSALAAGPALTTIQDVLYKADGARFNGAITVSWNSFQAADNSTIVTQSTTVKIVDGVLRVQLAPTTSAVPEVTYSVAYSSDGKVQFLETWAVPSTTKALHVRDVRIASSTPSNSSAADTGSTSIPESSVVGLIADLGSRPLKGAGYAAGATAVIDATGMLAAVTGAASDCVHVDGSSGPCGSGSDLSFIDNQALTGIVDGSNTSFGLSAIPNPASSLAVFRNGILQKKGSDYALSGTSIQFVAAATPQPGDTLLASFRVATGTDTDDTATAYSSPEVLCSGFGTSTNSQTLTMIGICTIASGVLQPGDRLDVRFDAAHPGATSAFSLEVDWGITVLAHRDASAADALVTGRGDVSILTSGAQLSSQSWGTVLPFATSAGNATDTYTNGIAISFRGLVGQSTDSVSLTNFTVVRIP